MKIDINKKVFGSLKSLIIVNIPTPNSRSFVIIEKR
jgi:hypothetical protein